MKHYPIVVIGAGAAGLVVAIGAAKAGKKVLMIEKGHWGGDCTNYGCIPSKSLIASADSAHRIKSSESLGIQTKDSSFDTTKSLERVRNIVQEIRSHEDSTALEKLGVETLTGVAAFTSPHTLKVNDEEIKADQIVIATGSYPFIPPIEGLKDTPYLTNETIFDLEKIPTSLAILGAGPIGCELAQAFQRLGSEVTIIGSKRGLLPKEEPEVAEALKTVFEKEGLKFHVRCETNQIEYNKGKFHLCIQKNGESIDFETEVLLVSTGRRPQLALLDLDNAGVTYSEKGVVVDKYGRTNQKHIFAIGDAAGAPFFTHLAENQGRSVLTTLILPSFLKKKLDSQAVPRVTFTDPEVAQVGLTEEEAIEKVGAGKIAVYKVPFSGVDRAITQGRVEGWVKVVTKKWSSQILGATIVGPRAGEMLPEISLAMMEKIPLRKLAKLIHPYPIYNAAIRKCADLWLTQTIIPQIRGKKS